MTTRLRLTRAQKVRVFDRYRGHCCRCGLKIKLGEPWHVDHFIPLWAGGPDTLDNMRPLHIACHEEKSSGEATDRAKELRVRANHLGVPKPGPKLPAGRHSAVKKKINGEVVSRPARGSEHERVMSQYPNWRGE